MAQPTRCEVSPGRSCPKRGRQGPSRRQCGWRCCSKALTHWDAEIWLTLQAKWDLWHALKVRGQRPKVRALPQSAYACSPRRRALLRIALVAGVAGFFEQHVSLATAAFAVGPRFHIGRLARVVRRTTFHREAAVGCLINRQEFGLTWNQVLETGGVMVGDRIDIAIDIEAVRQAATQAA